MKTIAAPRLLPRYPWRISNTRLVHEVLLITAVILGTVLSIVVLYDRPARYVIDVGTADDQPGLYPPEKNAQFTYAYMRGGVTLEFPDVGYGIADISLRMGGPNAQQSVDVAIGTRSRPLVRVEDVNTVRTYHILASTDATGTLPIKLDSTSIQPASDERILGALLNTIIIRTMGTVIAPRSIWWACPLALLLVWSIVAQWTRRVAVRVGVVAITGLALCTLYAMLHARLRIVPATYLTPLIALAVATPIAHALIVSRRRAALRAARWLTVPLLIFLATRFGMLMVAYIADPLISDGSNNSPPVTNVLVQVLTSRWDSAFYYDIVRNGYSFDVTRLSNVAFFPLLPLLIRVLAPVFGSVEAAGIIIVNVALLGAVILFYRLVDMEWGDEVAERAVWYLLIFPMSFFGSLVYTESLLLLTAIGALYCARRGYWGIAAMLGICASFSRFVGIVVAPMLLVEWWMQRRGDAPPSRWAALAACAVPLGTGMYMLYLWQRFDDPIAFIHASATWGRAPGSPFDLISSVFDRPNGGWIPALLAGSVQQNNFIDLFAVLAFIALGIVLLVQRRWSEATFMLGAITITFSSGLLASQRRYVWVLFPAFIILARWGQHHWIDRFITTVFLIGLGLFTAMIANHYWVA